MKKYIGFAVIALAAVMVGGCDEGSRPSKFQSYLSGELSDCKATKVSDGSGNSITVIRCPLSATTTVQPNGKSKLTIAVVDENPSSVAPKVAPEFKIEKPEVPVATQVAPDKVIIDGVEYIKK